jgi:cell division protein FtsN
VLPNPTRDREEADGLLRQLRGRGYDATLVRVVRDGDTWYRVQVGRFTSAEQAGEMMRRLREHEGVAHAFVASE